MKKKQMKSKQSDFEEWGKQLFKHTLGDYIKF